MVTMAGQRYSSLASHLKSLRTVGYFSRSSLRLWERKCEREGCDCGGSATISGMSVWRVSARDSLALFCKDLLPVASSFRTVRLLGSLIEQEVAKFFAVIGVISSTSFKQPANNPSTLFTFSSLSELSSLTAPGQITTFPTQRLLSLVSGALQHTYPRQPLPLFQLRQAIPTLEKATFHTHRFSSFVSHPTPPCLAPYSPLHHNGGRGTRGGRPGAGRLAS